jgi:hypothetical protein
VEAEGAAARRSEVRPIAIVVIAAGLVRAQAPLRMPADLIRVFARANQSVKLGAQGLTVAWLPIPRGTGAPVNPLAIF